MVVFETVQHAVAELRWKERTKNIVYNVYWVKEEERGKMDDVRAPEGASLAHDPGGGVAVHHAQNDENVMVIGFLHSLLPLNMMHERGTRGQRQHHVSLPPKRALHALQVLCCRAAAPTPTAPQRPHALPVDARGCYVLNMLQVISERTRACAGDARGVDWPVLHSFLPLAAVPAACGATPRTTAPAAVKHDAMCEGRTFAHSIQARSVHQQQALAMVNRLWLQHQTLGTWHTTSQTNTVHHQHDLIDAAATNQRRIHLLCTDGTRIPTPPIVPTTLAALWSHRLVDLRKHELLQAWAPQCFFPSEHFVRANIIQPCGVAFGTHVTSVA